MTTFGDLINDVLLAMEGWGLQQGRAAFISTVGGISASATTFAVADASNLSEGVAEIDDELVYIQSVTGLNVTIAPDGRGYRGTTATTHAQNARVTMSPILPRSVVKQKVNDSILGVYPDLRGRATTTVTYNGAKATYQLPADVDEIISVTYEATGSTGTWPKVCHYRLDVNANTTTYTTGKSLTILGGVEVGRTIQVVYAKKPSVLTALSDQFTSTGLAETARSVIVAGAVWRLSSFIAASRLRADSVSIDMMDEQNRVDAGNKVSAYLRAQYQQELSEEQRRQSLAQPPTISWGG